MSAYCLMVKTEGLLAGPSDIGSNPIGRFDSIVLESREHKKIIVIIPVHLQFAPLAD